MTQIRANGFEAPSCGAEVDTGTAGNGAVSNLGSTEQSVSQTVPASAYPSALQIAAATAYVPGGTRSFPLKPEGASATHLTPEDETKVQDHINEDYQLPPQEKTWYQKARDWTGDRLNEMGQAAKHPLEGLKGAVKEIGNMPAGLWNTMMVAGAAQAGSEMQWGAALMGGPDADKMMQLSQDMIQNPAKYAAPGMVEEAFKMNGPAQQGGADIFNVASMGGPAALTGAKAIGKLGAVANLVKDAGAGANLVKDVGAGANTAKDVGAGGANLATNTAKGVGERGGANLADAQFGTRIHSMVDEAYRALENPGKKVELPNGAYLIANRTIGGNLRPDIFYVDPVKKQFKIMDIYTGAKQEIYTPSGWDSLSHYVKGQNYVKEPLSQELLKDGYTYQGYSIASRPNVPPDKLH